MTVHMSHVLRAGQLAVGDLEEVLPTSELAEQVPGRAVGAVVDHVATFGLEVDRDSTILGHGEDEEQLLEVWPVILVTSPSDR